MHPKARPIRETNDMTTSRTPGRTRWLALIVLCLGSLMIVLDSTIVNVVLPSIRADLGFSPTSLAWVVNVYPLTFGGFLLLGGRLCDNADAVSRKVLEESIASIGAAPAVCGDAPGAAEAARRARAPEHNSGPFRRSLLTSSGSSMPYYRDYRERQARP